MAKQAQHLLAILVLAGLVGTVACQQRQEVDDEDIDADTTIIEDTDVMPPPAAPGADTMMGADTGMTMGGGGETAQVSVTNSMPHAMIVKADWGEGEMELGTVATNETKSFDVQAAGGSQVNLTATAEDASHSTTGTVTVGAGEPASWTIQ